MVLSKSVSVTLKRLFHSPLTVAGLILLISRFVFDVVGPENWIDPYVEIGWTTQFFNDLTCKVYMYYCPVAFSVIVAADYIQDHKNCFSGLVRVAAADKKQLFFGRICAYMAVGFVITFIGVYGEFAGYCLRSGFSFAKGYDAAGVAARLFIHYLSFSVTMVPFYTAFAIFFTSLFKKATGGIIISVVYIMIIRLIDMHPSNMNLFGNPLGAFVPFANYFYPVHGVPFAIETYLYIQDNLEAQGGAGVGFEHFATAFLCVTLCAVLMFIASYQFEKRFE